MSISDKKVEKERQRQAEKKQAQMVAAADDQMGPILRFGTYRSGCPMCGVPGATAQVTGYCPGFDERLGERQCQKEGKHLHVKCEEQKGGCGFFWRTQIQDSDVIENAAPLDVVAEAVES